MSAQGRHLGNDEGEHEQRERLGGVDHLEHDHTDADGAAQRAAEEGGGAESGVHAGVEQQPPREQRVVRRRKQPPADTGCRITTGAHTDGVRSRGLGASKHQHLEI